MTTKRTARRKRDGFRAVRPSVVVNGRAYNRLKYSDATIVLKQSGTVHTMTTTLRELCEQYGLLTAVKVRKALLNVGYKEVD